MTEDETDDLYVYLPLRERARFEMYMLHDDDELKLSKFSPGNDVVCPTTLEKVSCSNSISVSDRDKELATTTGKRIFTQKSILTYMHGSRSVTTENMNIFSIDVAILDNKLVLPAPKAQISSLRCGGGKRCPLMKHVRGTSFTVDGFSYGAVIGVTAYFLSHFHADHYIGLTRSWDLPIYCSAATGKLVCQELGVSSRFVTHLPLHQWVVLGEVEVLLLEAYHCPGSVVFVFRQGNGHVHVHTGDFRAGTFWDKYKDVFAGLSVDTLYLDTTYCSPSYVFPSQSSVVAQTREYAATHGKCSKTLVVCGAYTIGKEQIWGAVAEVLGVRAHVSKKRYNILKCFGGNLLNLATTGPSSLHVLPLNDINAKFLAHYLQLQGGSYKKLLAFKPTGWAANMKNPRRVTGAVTVLSLPYSEHSSFSELRDFVMAVKPRSVVPTVLGNIQETNAHITTWLS